MESRGIRIVKYAIYGFLLGLLFPLIGTVTNIIHLNLDLPGKASKQFTLPYP